MKIKDSFLNCIGDKLKGVNKNRKKLFICNLPFADNSIFFH